MPYVGSGCIYNTQNSIGRGWLSRIWDNAPPHNVIPGNPEYGVTKTFYGN